MLDVIEEEKLLERANTLGARVTARLESFARRNDIEPIGHIRGLGSMIAFDLVKERGSDEARSEAGALTAKALKGGLVLLSCGIYGETTPEQAEKLSDEGIEVAAIPWLPRADS